MREETQPTGNLRSEVLDPAYAKNYDGPTLDTSRYLTMRKSKLEGNPRQTEEYRRLCRDAVGVGDRSVERPLSCQRLSTQQVISSSHLYLYLDSLSTQQVISSS
jgi:hypothetical protein